MKCEPALAGQGPFNFEFLLVDRSGDPHLTAPQQAFGTQRFFIRAFDQAPCFSTVFESNKAELARIKLVVSRQATGEKLLVHDFLVGWMNINSVTLQAIGTTTDVAGGPPNILRADVTGNIPLMQDFSAIAPAGELGGLAGQSGIVTTGATGAAGPGSATTVGGGAGIPANTTVAILPTAWPALARALATVRGVGVAPELFWDIHDDQAPTEGHAQESSALCLPRVTTGIDAVDSCAPGTIPEAENGFFSSIYTNPSDPFGLVGPAIGPFDPARPGETYLADGKLDAFDAPMPPVRLDFGIAPNVAGGIAGVGSFISVDKGVCDGGAGEPTGCIGGTYVRPQTPTPQPHRFYAPFYETFLPATMANRTGLASGTENGLANNFPGYLNLTGNALDLTNTPTGIYDYWDIAEIIRSAPGAATACLFRTAFGTGERIFRLGPAGPQAVTVYTDEHGEARIAFNPGTGFFFDNLGAVLNANGACDLGDISTLGTAGITATARYPFQPVTAQPVTSAAVTKTVLSLFAKTLQCFPKGPGAQNAAVAICVVSAQDITGAAIPLERVCLMADFNAENIIRFPEPTGTGDIPGSAYTGAARIQGPFPAPDLGLRDVCSFTDVNGRAAFEVVNTNPTSVNVTAKFVDEGIFRHLRVQFPITAPTAVSRSASVAAQVSSATSSQGSTPSGTTPSGTTPSGTTPSGTTPSGTPTPQVTNPAAYRVQTARLVRPLRGRPYMLVRVKGPDGAVKVRIRMVGARKEYGSLTYAIPANKTMKISGLKIPRAVTLLRVSLV